MMTNGSCNIPLHELELLVPLEMIDYNIPTERLSIPPQTALLEKNIPFPLFGLVFLLFLSSFFVIFSLILVFVLLFAMLGS